MDVDGIRAETLESRALIRGDFGHLLSICRKSRFHLDPKEWHHERLHILAEVHAVRRDTAGKCQEGAHAGIPTEEGSGEPDAYTKARDWLRNRDNSLRSGGGWQRPSRSDK